MSQNLIVLICQVGLLPLLTYLFRGWLKQFTNRLASLEAWQLHVNNELNAKVSREDFIRETSRTRQTLERLMEGQARIEGKMDIGSRIATTLDRIAEEGTRG